MEPVRRSSEPTAEIPSSSPTLALAAEKVEELLLQLTEKDAPPCNDVAVRRRDDSAAATAEAPPSSTMSFSKQQHAHHHILRTKSPTALSSSPETDLVGTSSFETDASSSLAATTAFFQDYLRADNDEPHKHYPSLPVRHATSQSEVKMGHTALASLCRWTVSQLQQEEEDVPEVPLQIETMQLLQHVENVSTSSSPVRKKNATPVNTTKQHRRSRLRLPWKNGINKKKHHEEEKKEEEQTTTRLQMFGSEYARHLSKCQLAPAPAKSAATRLSFRRHHISSKNSTRKLEEAPPEILTGAVLDICITAAGEQADLPGSGYYRISETASGRPFHLSRKGNKLSHLWVKKEPSWDKAAQRPCITALAVIFPDRQEFVPPGFCIVRRYQKNGQHGPPANLNDAAGSGERVYLCFRRSREGNPVTGILPLQPGHGESIPVGYAVLERSPRNYSANLKHGSSPMFFAYRQRLANLETLRPRPLVLSVPSSTTTTDDDDNGTEVEARLQAYYCTGGTVVAADVGRFHIMDRSTHALLSPSSVATRLQLIEMSRRRSLGKMDSDLPTVMESSDSTKTFLRSESSLVLRSEDSFTDTDASSDGCGAAASPYCGQRKGALIADDAKADQSTPTSMVAAKMDADLSSLRHDVSDRVHPAILGADDPNLQKRLEAMAFIPFVETAVAGEQKAAANMHLKMRVTVLAPILTACYTRHGGAALTAVNSLTSLLTETDFFEDDVDRSDKSDDKSSTRLTLLDMAVQVVCDVTTTGTHEPTFASCIEFVETAVSFSRAQLNTRTIGYVVRCYLFVFYFGASIPGAATRWPNSSWRSLAVKSDKDFPAMLFDPRVESSSDYLPGGAPQSAVLAFKELISLSIERLGKVSVNDLVILARSTSDRQTSLSDGGDPYGPFLDSVLSSLVDDAVDHVERANYVSLALHQIHRSGGSELFWHDMVNACGLGLFGKDEKLGAAGRDIYVMIFAVLTNLVKLASGKPKVIGNAAELMPREIASKLLSLELLLHFLEYWSDGQEAVNGMSPANGKISLRSTETLAFIIRRTVVPCLLWNTRSGLEDPQVYGRVIRIVSELWCSPVYRKHCKIELGVLIEHLGLRLLALGPQLVAPKRIELRSHEAHISMLAQQVELLNQIKNWFSGDPEDVLDLYLNYDTDISIITGPVQLLPGTQLKIFQRLCDGLSNIAEQCGELIGDQIRLNQSMILSESDRRIGGLSEMLASMEESSGAAVSMTRAREAARLLRKTSLEAISQIVKSLAITAAAASGHKFASLLLSWTPVDSSVGFERPRSWSEANEEPGYTSSVLIAANPSTESANDGDDEVLRFWRDAIADDHKKRAADSAPTTQESLETALEIAQRKSLKKAVEYLIACNALTPAPRDIANFLRIQNERLDPTDLGKYLGEGGTGGAETEYWNSIRHTYVRAISFMGMNVEEGLRHFLTSCGFRLPGEAQMIDRIMSSYAQCYFEDNAGDKQLCPFKDQDTVFLLAFALIMLNTDLHKSDTASSLKPRKKMTKADFIINLRGAEQGNDISREYLSAVYDSIEANPIAMHEDTSSGSDAEDRNQALQDMLNNVRTADSLLRGLAVHDFKFASVDDFTASLDYSAEDALSDLTRSCVSKTWHQWHGVINTGLETAHLDPKGMEPSVEILLYALSLTIFLDMPTERAAFLSQLGRLKIFEERRQGRWVSAPTNSHRKEAWYHELEEACDGPEDSKLWALQRIHEWITSLQSALLVDVQNKVEMTRAVAELKHGDFLLQDPARCFVRSGDLIKKSGKTGRMTKYRFYLFSDVLLYAKKEDAGNHFKIHEELPLHLMKIIDWFPPSQKTRKLTFEVHHPRKSFAVTCETPEERKAWVEDIRASVNAEVDRKMKLEAARLAIYPRMAS